MHKIHPIKRIRRLSYLYIALVTGTGWKIGTFIRDLGSRDETVTGYLMILILSIFACFSAWRLWTLHHTLSEIERNTYDYADDVDAAEGKSQPNKSGEGTA